MRIAPAVIVCYFAPPNDRNTRAVVQRAQIQFHLAPGGRLTGRIRVPGDKSISHRAVILGSLAEGTTEISGFLAGADTLATRNAFQQMGVPIWGPEKGELRIQGLGMRGLRPPQAPLDLGNSGTAMRLLCGLLAGQGWAVSLVGDASLSRRPMRRVTEPLGTMGARIQTTAAGTAPLHIHPSPKLNALHYALPVASAQVKSALLLAGLYAEGETCITEPGPARDHTERMLAAFGYPVRTAGNRICIQGGGKLRSCALAVPADISSAAFFLVGASIAPGSDLLLEGVGMNPTRTGILHILQQMGADIRIERERESGGEPIADLRVRAAPLHGIEIPRDQVPLAIDEFPAIFIAAACAEGETILRGAEELRVKESDRLQVMAEGLAKLGIENQLYADGIRIQGGELGGGVLDSHGDHRIAMAFAMAALRAQAPITIQDCANVNTSFPDFAALASQSGLGIQQR